jgi:ABC-type Fe3+-hydroxamate transport system substrate-binding protein
MRIISTVPSITELLFDLGLDEEVVGITKFCVHPDLWYRNKTRIGGTKNLKLDVIRQLNPDLIIANKEENTKEDIEALDDLEIVLTDIKKLEDNYGLIENVAYLCNRKEKGHQLSTQFENAIESLRQDSFARGVYFIWKKPFMSVGSDTYIHSIMNLMGIENALKDQQRYPALSEEDIYRLNIDLALFSSEPFPFKARDISDFEANNPNTRAFLVDGEFFSWYGSRLIKMKEYGIQLSNELRKALS